MTKDPEQSPVERTAAFETTVAGIFPRERPGDGTRPSLSDFESLYWPDLEGVLSTSWRSATAVEEDHPELMVLVMRAVKGTFPPARVVFARSLAERSDPATLRVIGIEFDWDYWPIDDP